MSTAGSTTDRIPDPKHDGKHGWKHWHLDRDLDDVAWLAIDQADDRVNTLGTGVIAELEAAIGELERMPPRGLIVISRKPGTFIAGADIREFDTITDSDALRGQLRRVHELFRRIEELAFPTVAAIAGTCLGGGLELALCCNWRVALDTDATRLGFPEVNLGIYPGFGGSGRSIRALGGLAAMELMLTGRTLSAAQARAQGLVDDTVGRHGSLRWAARNAVLDSRRSRGPGLIARATRLAPVRPLLVRQMRRRTASRARPEHYPAPYRLIDAFARHGGSTRAMIEAEIRNVPDLLTGATSGNLRRVYRLTERLKQQGRRSDFDARRIHVIGAGVMGGDIAAWCASRGLEVTLQDRAMKQIEPAIERATKLFERRLKTPAAVAAARARLRADPDGDGVARADVVIEAIFEDRDAKHALFEELRGRVADHTLIATNTSAIPLADLCDALDDPSRLIGLHFFNPVASMPLVEVVHDTGTDPARVADGCSFATAIGKYAVPVTSTPGFLVNRVLVPYLRKAMELHRGDVPLEALDAAAERFGMPMGPVEVIDSVGLDIGLGVIETMHGSGSTDTAGADRAALQARIDRGKLGRKSGEGFYVWKNDEPQKDRDAADGHDLEELARLLITPYLDECEACLNDRVVEDTRDGSVAGADLLDAGMIFGSGFPPFRGGPLHFRRQRTPASGSRS